MEKNVQDILANLPGKEIMAQWPPEAVNAIEALKACVLNNEFEKEMLVAVLKEGYEKKIAELTDLYDKQLNELKEAIYALQRKLNTNSQNSGIPPSQDPFRTKGNGDKKEPDGTQPGPEDKDNGKPDDSDTNQAQDGKSVASDTAKPAKRKQGGQKGHEGHSQKLCQTKDIRPIPPVRCPCGCGEIINLKPSQIHQHIELPESFAHVIHYWLLEGTCAHCGQTVKASPSSIPMEHQTGYGSNFTAIVGALIAVLGGTRRSVLDFIVNSGFFKTENGESIPLSLGTLNNLVDRCSDALTQPLAKIREVAHTAPINYIDETSWPMFGPQGAFNCWLWTMSSPFAVYFNIHRNRNTEAFHELRGDWFGYLVSDGYRLYRKWPEEFRQSCLAHLLRNAKKWKEDPDKDISRGGEQLYKELCRLDKMQPETLTKGKWRAWVMRVRKIFKKFAGQRNGLGALATRLQDTFASLSTFLRIQGVEPTNNRAERSLRTPVTRRKVSFGSTSKKGLRWIERAISVLMTCRLHGWSFFNILRDGVNHVLKGTPQRLFQFNRLKRKARCLRRQMGLA